MLKLFTRPLSTVHRVACPCGARFLSSALIKNSPSSKPSSFPISYVGLREASLYSKYVSKAEGLLHRGFPTIYNEYSRLKEGSLALWEEGKAFRAVRKKLSGKDKKSLSDMSPKELDLLLEFPASVRKVAPLVPFFLIPVIGYLVIPIAIYFPTALTHHFWPSARKGELFHEHVLKRRRYFYFLHQNLEQKAALLGDRRLYKTLNRLLIKMGNCEPLSVSEILSIKEVFSQPQFSVHSAHKTLEKRELARSLGVVPSSLSALQNFCRVIWHMDRAILKQATSETKKRVDIERLMLMCCRRSYHFESDSKEDMSLYMKNWLEISSAISVEESSLYFYLPMMLSCEHTFPGERTLGQRSNKL